MNLSMRILTAMMLGLGLGIVLNLWIQGDWLGLGATLNQSLVTGVFEVIGKIFVASLKLLVVPLVFVSLVCGTCSLGGQARMGLMGGKTILLYMVTTALAITLALLVATIIAPGDGINLQTDANYVAKEAPSIKQVIINIFPSNPVKAMAEGNMLQIIVFAILVGLAIGRSGEAGERVSAAFRDLDEVVMKMVLLLMQLAPYGVFCLMAKTCAELGLDAILTVGKYFFAVIFVLLLHAVLVYGGLLSLGGINPLMFFSKIRPAALFAFSTASSNATMPITLNTVEHRLGVDNSVASFTVPLGATINMDGTAIMQGVATLFIAQAYGIDIGAGGYLAVIATATLASVGTAGVPGVGLITLAMVLQQVNLPVEAIGMIIGVDRLLDMTRTAVNVTGDSAVTCLVAKSEGLMDKDKFADPHAGGEVES